GRDPWVNLLRATLACFSAAVAGADSITTLGYDAALGQPDELSARIARNTQLILLEESNLARVSDPTGGSYAVERLTDDLARAAWAVAQRVEGAGGVEAGLRDGSVQALLDAAWSARESAVARRKEPITGVSEFPSLDEELP